MNDKWWGLFWRGQIQTGEPTVLAWGGWVFVGWLWADQVDAETTIWALNQGSNPQQQYCLYDSQTGGYVWAGSGS